ncbi:MAG: alpha/beta hydrolase fold domain-containing protein [Archangiaceae bacterium]|nr:alpha/beta hydrolase fold domain-containing protein [Archangiaceae bacterium]
MRATLGGLSCQVFPESEAGKPAGAVVLCHGFGAPGDDLVPLHGELLHMNPALSKLRFIFPEAPLSLGPGSRAWWLIDFEGIERVNRGDPEALREFRKVEPPGMAAARAALRKLVDEVCVQTKLPISSVVLGGFSQGAMLATDVALRLEEQPRALAILSGTLLIEDVWRQKAKARKGLKVLQAHGTEDPILRFDAAEWLRDLLKEAGCEVDFVPFRGGHTISSNTLEKLSRLLADTSAGGARK